MHDRTADRSRPAKSGSTSRQHYRAPAEASVVEVSSKILGVTNGLFLKFPTVFAVGDLSLVERPRVAIVGARKAGPDGLRRAEQLARDLALAGVVVVSGLAEGIDRAAHESAIAHGGRTIAVVGTPLDKVYPPAHADLQEIVYRDHLLLSPFRWGDRFFPSNFPERNRIMARLAQATVIVEASDTSGSLHQAAESLAVDHPVVITRAVAEDPKLKWPARFLDKPGVHVMRSSADVLSLLGR